MQKRIRALADYPRYSVPFRKNGFVYFYKNDGLQNQAVLYVQKGLDGTPEVLLDPNTFSADSTVRLESFALSRDGRYAAYETTAIPGSDWRDLHVLDMATGKPLPDRLRWVRFSTTAWRGDGFYYSRYPEPARGSELTAPTEHQSVYFHRVGTAQGDDVLVFEDSARPLRFNSIQTTEDERFAIRTSQEPGRLGNDLWVRDETASDNDVPAARGRCRRRPLRRRRQRRRRTPRPHQPRRAERPADARRPRQARIRATGRRCCRSGPSRSRR